MNQLEEWVLNHRSPSIHRVFCECGSRAQFVNGGTAYPGQKHLANRGYYRCRRCRTIKETKRHSTIPQAPFTERRV